MDSRLDKILSELTPEELFEIEGGCDCCVSDKFAEVIIREEPPITLRYGVLIPMYGVIVPLYGMIVKYGVPPIIDREVIEFAPNLRTEP